MQESSMKRLLLLVLASLLPGISCLSAASLDEAFLNPPEDSVENHQRFTRQAWMTVLIRLTQMKAS